MKLKPFVTIATATVITVATGSYQPSQAQTSGFYCGSSNGAPATVYQNRQGNSEVWIRWTSNHFSGSGYTPQQRCEEVSSRLESYRRAGSLKLITVGRMNNQNVICTASQVNGHCENLIFTLKPSENAIRTLTNFLAWREGQAGVPSMSESAQVPYIDVSAHLDSDAAAPTPAVTAPAPANTQPAVPQPDPQNQGGMREL